MIEARNQLCLTQRGIKRRTARMRSNTLQRDSSGQRSVLNGE
jgi:hypothetical protein